MSKIGDLSRQLEIFRRVCYLHRPDRPQLRLEQESRCPSDGADGDGLGVGYQVETSLPTRKILKKNPFQLTGSLQATFFRLCILFFFLGWDRISSHASRPMVSTDGSTAFETIHRSFLCSGRCKVGIPISWKPLDYEYADASCYFFVHF
jgi:hypothetical protein